MPKNDGLAGPALALRLEQARRWRQGDRAPAEDYLARHPALAADAEYALEVIYGELLLREEQGERPSPDEFLARFPHLAPQLRRLLEVHAAVRSASRPDPGDAAAQRQEMLPEAGGPAAAPPLRGYEILGELGRGGMGVVYKARHLSLNRVVALKMILAGAQAGPEEVARFRAEAKAVARLQHPHIVQIFEVGEADGRLFLALEFVDGGSLAERLAGSPLPARQAAELTEALACAVHYAHRQGVVHRDLKPANVLLSLGRDCGGNTGYALPSGSQLNGAEPKITDFGLAKRLEGGAGPTRSGDVLGTPSYMAPEQAEGRPREVGPATDVYALGAILYELLTGRPPFRAESPLETLLQVRAQEPVAPRSLQPKVPRDLETICLKCLRKEPHKRYAGADTLADDLQRFLDGRPIRARPVGPTGRLWRWCRRRPAVAILAAALVLAMALGFPAVTFLWLSTDYHRRLAEQRLEERRLAVRQHYIDLSEIKLGKEPGTQGLRKKLLDEALAYFQSYLQEAPDDPKSRYDVAEAYYRVGKITAQIGSKEEALDKYRQARDRLEQLVRDGPTAAKYEAGLARVHYDMGRLESATGLPDEALRSYERSRDLYRKLLEADPDGAPLHHNLAAVYGELGALQYRQGRREEARASFEEARRLLEGLAPAHPDDSNLQSDLARVYHNFGHLYFTAGETDAALPLYQKVLGIRKELASAHPTDPDLQFDLAKTYTAIGELQCATGQAPAGLDSFLHARKVLEKLGQANPGVTEYQLILGQVCGAVANVQLAAGQVDQAQESCETARAVFERLVGGNPTDTSFRAERAGCYNNLGDVHYRTGQSAEALRFYGQARAAWEELVRADPTDPMFRRHLASSHTNIGNVHLADRPAEALGAYRLARAVCEELVRAHPDAVEYRINLAVTWHNSAKALRKLGRRPEALADYREAVTHQRAVLEKAPQLIQCRQALSAHYFDLAATYRELDLPDEAAAVTLDRKQLWPAHPGELYNVACEFALCIPLVGKNEASVSPGQQAQRERYAGRAVEALRSAIAAGFKDVAQLRKDPDLDALRGRPDFQELLVALGQKPGAKSR
jgi:serine/threonine protein kinase/tetratricopeptide (TPR) repeat protein